jgi:hypothetical protein
MNIPDLALHHSSKLTRSFRRSTAMNMMCFPALMGVLLLLTMPIAAQPKIEQWDRFEITFHHAPQGNGFTDVTISATFSGPGTRLTVPGFYDGGDIFKIRFMPEQIGTWKFETSSNIQALAGKTGSFECVPATGTNHGVVKVSESTSFRYADGKRFYPFGTTAYAWIHMKANIQETTLATLARSGFNKVRMCVFPKEYDLLRAAPERFPYAIKVRKKDAKGQENFEWDFNVFDPDFFRHLEKRIDDLRNIGVEADLILFHPYDKGRWGFDAMPKDVNRRYVQYLTARLSSFRNVWWSLANEWDYVKTKTRDDWEELSKVVVASDPYRHLCSIHGSTAHYFEYWEPQFTHVSIQDDAPVQFRGGAATLLNVYHKPVICDEVGYEGNLKQRWGRLSPEELTYLAWMGALAGVYVTHGECYLTEDDTTRIFWAEGGELKGRSWPRFKFLREVLETGPGPLSMSDIGRDYHTASGGKGYYIIYFGKEMLDSWLFNLPVKNGAYGKVDPGTRFRVEIIDTWSMTIQSCPLTFEATSETDYRVYDKAMKKVRLPLRPYLALRITAINSGQ